jgi:hypothetical protein
MADHDITIVRDKILTFRTITTLLEVLQFLNGSPMSVGHWQFPLLRGFSAFAGKSNTDDHGEYLAALATLLAREHGFAAVAITHRQSSIWELTVCNHEERPKTTVIPGPQMTASETHSSTIREERFSILSPDACDIDPSNPLPYLRKTWYVLNARQQAIFLMHCIRTSQSYQEHAAAVARLFSLHMHVAEKLGTLVYVASKTYRRTLRRIQHPKYSLPFLDSLFAIEKSQNLNTQRPFPADEPLRFRDIIFIKTLSEPNIQPVLDLSKINIPNLMAAVNDYQANGTPPCIYTDNTCHEFHQLLCHLLHKFKEFLLALDKYTGCALLEDDLKPFDITAYRVAICGITLRDLIYSSYLAHHLARMELPDHGC